MSAGHFEPAKIRPKERTFVSYSIVRLAQRITACILQKPVRHTLNGLSAADRVMASLREGPNGIVARIVRKDGAE